VSEIIVSIAPLAAGFDTVRAYYATTSNEPMYRSRSALTAACVLSIAGIMVCSAPAAARAKKRPRPCVPTTARRVLANSRAEIFTAPGPFSKAREYYGCATGSRLRVDLGVVNDAQIDFSGSRQVRLVGTIAALETSGSAHASGSSFDILVYDVKRRRLLRRLPTGTPTPTQTKNAYPETLEGVGDTTALVLQPDGAVAWIVHDTAAPDPPTYQVIKANAGQPPTVLATGTDIDPTSLALGGTVLYWEQNNSPHSAQLR